MLLSEMHQVLPSLVTAFMSVKSLRIRFQHQLYVKGRSNNASRTGKPFLSSSFAIITRELCIKLAAALPNLESLALEGNCVDAAFSAFGARCPRLHHLQVEIPTVPLEALTNVSRLLPNLTCFTFLPPRAKPHASEISKHVAAVMIALQPCTLLSKMNLDLTTRNFPMECLPARWQPMPTSLIDVTFKCARGSIVDAPPVLLNSVQKLNLSGCSGADLFSLLEKSAQLGHISLPRSLVMTFACDTPGIAQGISLLKQRMQAGFLLEVCKVRLVGLSANVEDVLRMLPPLIGVLSCTLEILDPPNTLLLVSLNRVFPSLELFELINPHEMVEVPEDVDTVLKLVEALWACPHILEVAFRSHINFSTSQLACFCDRMKCLERLSFVDLPSADVSELRVMLDEFELDIELPGVLNEDDA